MQRSRAGGDRMGGGDGDGDGSGEVEGSYVELKMG